MTDKRKALNATDGGLVRAGLNLIQQALTIYDGDLRLAVSNSRFREMFGLPAELTEPGAHFSDTLRFLAKRGDYGEIEDFDAFIEERVNLARTFQPHYMERTRANGRTISVDGSPLESGGWVTVYTDITAIKRHEEMLRSRSEHLSDQLLSHAEDLARTNRELAATVARLEEAQRSLRDSEALVRTTTEMLPAHIAHLDLDEVYTYSNRKLPIVLPGKPAAITAMTAREALGEEAYLAIEPHLARAFGGEADVFEFSHGESARRIRVSFTPDTDPAGTVRGVYVLSMDVTEEAQARAVLVQSNKRALAAQLTSGLAHDFSNLLTIILGLQGRLEKLRPLPDGAREMISTTRAAALRGGALLDRIAGISQRRELRPRATDLRSLLADIRAMASPSLPDAVSLDCRIGDLERAVIVDPGFLQDSLLNLVLNARDAIGDRPGAIEIDLRTVRDSWLEIVVRDSGPGFSEEARQHALDPFYSTKPKREGSGLGLPMVYDFVQLSGGRINIRNGEDRGARVALRLPLKYAASQPEPRLVLLVEDDVDIRETLRENLRNLGHAVLEAASADEAETLAAAAGADTVLTDITLEGRRSGLDLARALRDGAASPARVYLMTSLPPSDSTRREAESEFPLIGKPFTQAELSDFLETGPQT